MPGCSEHPASSLNTQAPEGLDQGHCHVHKDRWLCRSWPPLSSKLKAIASVCSGRPAGMRTPGRVPRQVRERTCDGCVTLCLNPSMASHVPGIKLRCCAEVCRPCTAWNLHPVVSPYGRVFSMPSVTPHTQPTPSYLWGPHSEACPGLPGLPTADEVWSHSGSPGFSVGTLGWGTWLLIGACKALESIKDDTSEVCSC